MTGPPPYVGLAPFGEADADRFFGRDAERKRIIANLMASRLTLLYARSGVGKSSLLRAGVVARLAAAPGSRLVPFVFSSWRGDPNVELPRALGTGGEGLEQALERRTADIDGTLLVILDQFEEFFEYHRGTPEGGRFADELARCVLRTDLRAHFLVSIREDAYSRIGDEFKGRLPNVYSNYLHLDDLDERGARAAIVEPLRHVSNGGGTIEPALVDRVLHDVRRNEASNGDARYETAHLQYILRRLWDEEARRGDRVLRLATLEHLGGSAAIFERHFDEAVAGLRAAEQDALAGAFRFLVTSAGTKRAESAADLADLAEVPPATLERALEHLREARVLTPVAAGGQTRYELSHDLLAEPALEWRRKQERARELRALRRTAAGLGLVAVVLAGLIVWALLERAAAARQADRAEAQKLVAESVNQRSRDPERSIRLARDAWQLSDTPQAEDALRRAIAASPVRRRLDVGTTLSGVLASNGEVAVSAGPDRTQVWRGMQRPDPALRLASGEPVVVSADGSVVVVKTKDGIEIARTNGRGSRAAIAGARAPAVSSDGRHVAALDRSRRVVVVDARTGREVARRRVEALVPILAFDPSAGGRLLVADCLGSTVTVWNWRAGHTRTLGARSGSDTRIPEAGRPLCLLAVSGDGSRAAQSHLTGSVTLWALDRGAGRSRELVPRQSVRDIAWSSGGDRLAVAAGKAATVFDRSGRELSATPAQIDFVNGVDLDPNADLMTTFSRDGIARIWDVRRAGLLMELRGHGDEIDDAVFTADGRDVVTLSLDGSVRSWAVVEGPVIWHADWVLDVAFSPDGRRLATATADGGARVTPLDGGRPTSIRASLQQANSIAFDAEARRVAVAGARDSRAGRVVVADAATGEVQHALEPEGQAVLTADFSPDGEWLVTTGERAIIPARANLTPALWRLPDFRGLAEKPTARLAMPKGTYALRAEFSPDGRTIVTAGNDGVARVYDAGTHALGRELDSPGLLYGATFSPDGRRILTYGSDFVARTWDARSGRRLAAMQGHSSWISRADFSPGGRLVVTGSADQTTRVWDSRTGQPLSTQRMHGDAVNGVDYGRGGVIASGGDDAAARLYPCATCEPVGSLIGLARERLVSPP